MKLRNTLTAIVFLVALAAGALWAGAAFLDGEGQLEGNLKSFLRDPATLPEFLASAESSLNRDLDREHTFIQLYGAAQRLSLRRVVEDMDPNYTVVKLADGSLSFQNLEARPVDQIAHADALAGLKDALDVPLLYVQIPQKVSSDALPEGVPDFGDQNADQLLSALSGRGVSTFDLRPALRAAGAWSDGTPLFFRTDHHWTPEGAFVGFQSLLGHLTESYGYSFDSAITDPANYDREILEDYFLGSQGKRVGTLYAGTDPITKFVPRFETSFTYSAPNYKIDRTGPFETSLLFPEYAAEKDYFNGNPYVLYSGGDYSLSRITNHKNPGGPRILLIRESYSCALTPFLALGCSELDTIDLRYFNDDLLEYVEWLDPDLVMVAYGASSTKLDQLFEFIK